MMMLKMAFQLLISEFIIQGLDHLNILTQILLLSVVSHHLKIWLKQDQHFSITLITKSSNQLSKRIGKERR